MTMQPPHPPHLLRPAAAASVASAAAAAATHGAASAAAAAEIAAAPAQAPATLPGHAVSIVRRNPLAAPAPADLQPVPAGTPYAALAPATAAPLVLRVNGQHLLRADWQRPAQAGDVIEWLTCVQGRDFGRTLLQIAAQVAIGYFTGGIGNAFLKAAATIALSYVSSAFISGLYAQDAAAPGDQAKADQVHTTSLQANTARLDQPIPVQYGYHRRFPDLAAQAYTTFDGDTDDQYYHAVMCIGMGDYTVHRVLLDDTQLAHFADVEYAILPPGTAPTLVSPRIITSVEVTGQDLDTAVAVGPFAASGPRQPITHLGYDIVCPALGIAGSGGAMSDRTITWLVECRAIDSWGLPVNDWFTLHTGSLTAASIKPVRRSYEHELPGEGRYEVRITRTDAQSDNRDNYDDAQLAALRATLARAAPLNEHATHIEVRMRASGQLNGLSQRRIAVLATRMLPTWTPAGGWSSPVMTRNPAWALADKWRSTVYGDGLADTDFDLPGLYALAQVFDARQDRFDFVFDATTDSHTADQMIASAGRAAVVRRNGLRVLVRDQAQDLPVAAFGSRQIAPDEWAMTYSLPTTDAPDGVRVEYLDRRSWDWEPLDVPLPGVATPKRLQVMRLPGIIGREHAKREAAFIAAALYGRRGRAAWTTEMDGALPPYGAAVRFAPPMIGWAQSGDVVDVAGSNVTVSEPLDWSGSGTRYISFIGATGTPTPPIACTQGATPDVCVLSGAPGITLVTDDAYRERTKYTFGRAAEQAMQVQLRAIEPQPRSLDGAPQWRLSGIIDDPFVHEVDEPWLPAPGEDQDAIDIGGTDDSIGNSGQGSGVVLVMLADVLIEDDDGGDVSYTLHPDGRATVTAFGTTSNLANQWVWKPGSLTPEQAAAYEARMVATGTALNMTTGTLDTWQPLDTARTWTVTAGPVGTLVGTLSIRRVADEVVLDTASVTLYTNDAPGGGEGA